MSTIRLLPQVAVIFGLGVLAAACDREKQETPATLASQGTPVPSVAASPATSEAPR